MNFYTGIVLHFTTGCITAVERFATDFASPPTPDSNSFLPPSLLLRLMQGVAFPIRSSLKFPSALSYDRSSVS